MPHPAAHAVQNPRALATSLIPGSLRAPGLAAIALAAIVLLPAAALGQTEQPHPVDLADLVARREWPIVMTFVVWTIVRLLKDDTRLPKALNIPSDLRPLAPIALGALSGILEHVIKGVPWRDAMAGAVVTAVGSITFQDAFARVLVGLLSRIKGREVSLLPDVLAARPASRLPPAAGQARRDKPGGTGPAGSTDLEVVVVIDAEETTPAALQDEQREKRP